MEHSLAPEQLRLVQKAVKSDAAASQALRTATRAFSMENTGEVVQLVNGLIQGFLQSALPSTSSWTKVYTFGSSGLGAAIAGSDIDLIALCSSTIDVNLFFTKLPHFLNGHLTDLVVVTSARVPLIKFTYHTVHVDLLFASVDLAEPPSAAELLRDDFLFSVSELSRATVNGIRTILEIRRRLRVPPDDYACVLRAVKYWASRRQVYGNLYTFPNGVCLAIMVARAAQLCPVPDPSAQVRFFFHLYVRWLSQSTRIPPISIVEQTSEPAMAAVPGMTRAWDVAQDTNDLLPILNPARPTVNAAYTMGRCGLQLFYHELRRAHRLLEKAAASGEAPPYSALWEPYNVLQEYRYFVGVHIASVHESPVTCENTLNAWKGLIESKLRLLVYALESVAEVRPLPRPIVDAASNQIIEHGVTLWQSSRVFFFGVRCGDAAVQQSMFADAMEQFEYAVEEATLPRHGFIYDAATMRGPWFSFTDKEQPPATAGSPLHALQAACARSARQQASLTHFAFPHALPRPFTSPDFCSCVF